MKKTPIAVALAVILVTWLAAPSAFAWHHGPRVSIGVGFGFGVPYAAYPYYYPPYYAPYPVYYPAPVVVQQQPTVYIEQQPAIGTQSQQSAPANYWYYCAGSRAYYPYVRDCPAGWQRVPPQPG